MAKQEPVPVTGVWLRTMADRIEVLVEIDGKWRLIIQEPTVTYIEDAISHIIEPLGIRKAPPDPGSAS